MCRIAALALVLGLLPAVPSYANPVSEEKELIEAAVMHAEALVTNYPPDEYFVLNLGVGNTFIGAALRNLFPDSAMQAAYFFDSPVTLLGKDEKTLARAIAMSLPPPEVLRGRKIVISRPLYFGDTVKRAIDLVPEISRSYGSAVDIEFSLISAGSLSDTYDGPTTIDQIKEIADRPGSGVRVVRDDLTIQRYLYARYDLFDNFFEEYSPYEPITADDFIRNGGRKALQANPRHSELVEIIDSQHPTLRTRITSIAATKRLQEFMGISAMIDFCKRP